MEPGSSQGCGECSSNFGFGFNDVKYSDRTLRLEIIPELTVSKPDHIDSLVDSPRNRKRCKRVDELGNCHEIVQRNEIPETRMKLVHINTLILAAKSPFFCKLFSNGMAESNQHYVTLQIEESEETAFMDLLKFTYTCTLPRSTPSAILDVLIVADKYEVTSCIKYCFQVLLKLPMTRESALACLDLPSTILMADTSHLLKDAAEKFFVARYKNMSKFQEEMFNLTLAGIEAVLSSDELQVSSEDEIYDLVMKWAQRHYREQIERQEILNTRLLPLIRVSFMSGSKLKKVLVCTDINLELRSKLFFDMISLETRQLPQMKERAYKLRPVKVVKLYSPREECVVYLDLKREECTRLVPSAKILSQTLTWADKSFT